MALAFWNPEIAKHQAIYKPATDNVFSWLRSLYGCSEDTKVNYYRTLASRAARDGKQMPDNILDDLQDAIELRSEAANWFRRAGTAHAEECRRHEHIISVLQDILAAFGPSSPLVPLPGPSTSPAPLRAPSPSPSLSPARRVDVPWRSQRCGPPEWLPVRPRQEFGPSAKCASVPRNLKSHLIHHQNWRVL
ncbi:hypothetical protein A1O7_02352 [Cladophialophora yegresii CBS 114405]|uniref:DUF6604 domain-containing protein n=1 Tax=Cladophialophora yegresii CBS 114405 TaxID=1182544 RepID=W9WBI4_9EURO|nr:uncharacterized protein A1O7_02352 [Cladophialophora yegresii CBS 114405]EXJ61921.1 hypothetical protein A1O7_02352 [Cladophialophora yegresii CBS 114405]